ncbi:MAG: hypothetical protein IJK26_02865 [Clostridia bacterium]|nr:hypothetical protein [Clostridia bacterium]
MNNKQIMGEIEEHINDIEDNKYMRLISSDILSALDRELFSFLYSNIKRFGLSEKKLSKSRDEIFVLFNREEQRLDIKVDIKNLKRGK